MRFKLFLFCLITFILLLLTSCSTTTYDDTKINDLEFTVLSDEDIPNTIMEIIEKDKDVCFRKTYTDHDFLYIIIGYGAQPTTGYSITIEDLYEGKNAIFVSCMLKGPSKREDVTENITYPYVVLKLNHSDKTVIFK